MIQEHEMTRARVMAHAARKGLPVPPEDRQWAIDVMCREILAGGGVSRRTRHILLRVEQFGFDLPLPNIVRLMLRDGEL